MKKTIFIKVCGVSLLVLMVASSLSMASEKQENELKPYFGAGIQQRHMSFVEGKGNGLFRKNFPQYHFYMGLKFNDYFGLEQGYEFSTYQKSTKTFVLGQTFLNASVPAEQGLIVSENRMRMQGLYINAVGFIPITEDKTDILLSLGMGLTNIKFQVKQIANAQGLLPETGVAESNRNFSATRMVPRFSVGIQHMFLKNYGLRALVAGEGTAQIKNIYARESGQKGPLRASLKNSIIYQISLFAKF